MPILHRLKVVCDGCDNVQIYDAEVRHQGEGDWDSIGGTAALQSCDIEHDIRSLPKGWVWERQRSGALHVLCPMCAGKQ
jgi:ribosomal protein S27E